VSATVIAAAPATLTPARPRIGRALVTGCAGFMGSHLTEALLADGTEVVGVDCFNANYGRAQKRANLHQALDWEAFDFVPLDLARGELEELVEDVDVVFHLAAEPGALELGRRLRALRHEQHRRDPAAAAGAAGGPRSPPRVRVVVLGLRRGRDAADPRGRPARPCLAVRADEAQRRHLCNVYHANHGLELATLRYFTVFGPRQRPDMAFNIFCRAALAGEEIVLYGDGHQTRDFTYVGDVVEATRRAGVAPIDSGGAYNIGGGLRGSLFAVVAAIEELTGRPLRVRHDPRQAGDVRDTGAETSRARAPGLPAVDVAARRHRGRAAVAAGAGPRGRGPMTSRGAERSPSAC
jgi:UDP-glucuronate 4-epimerase